MTMTIIMSEMYYNVCKLATGVDRAESVVGFYNGELPIAEFLVWTHVVWATAEFLVGEVNG